MAFQIVSLTFDFHGGNANVVLNEPPTPPTGMYSTVQVQFPLKPVPSGGTPDAATAAEIRAEAKKRLMEAAAAL